MMRFKFSILLLLVPLIQSILSAAQVSQTNDWSIWSSWSKCSLSCGVGVRSRVRYCSTTSRNSVSPRCQGPAREFSTCNHQTCPGLSEDPRAQQCRQIRQVFGNRRTTWQPYIDEQYPCTLYCRPRGYSVFYSFGKSKDGSKCGARGSQDLCIQGKCTHVGCDLVVGSNTRTDMCGKCAGNNTTCYFNKGLITKKPNAEDKKSGYIEMWIIPKGATHIKVTDKSDNYLAVKTVFGSMPVNGNKILTSPRIFELAGTQVRYYRSWNNSYEVLEALGPLSEDICIMVLLTMRKIEITYEYWLPKSLPGSPGKFPQETTPPPKQWVSWGPWTVCTASCAGGIRVRARECNPLYLRPCYGGDTESKKCNTHPCHGWSAWSNWGSCSATCKGGSKIRKRFCYSKSNVDCQGPITEVAPCNQHSCNIKDAWLPWESWGRCSISCGVGVTVRQRKCNPATRGVCLGPNSEVRVCYEKDCHLGDEIARGWTEPKLNLTCGKCRKVHSRRRHFCQSDVVVRALMNIEEESSHDKTVIKIIIRKIYKASKKITRDTLRVHVPDKCGCPSLVIGEEYLIMSRIHVDRGEMVLMLTRESYVRKWQKYLHPKFKKMAGASCN